MCLALHHHNVTSGLLTWQLTCNSMFYWLVMVTWRRAPSVQL